MKKNKNDLCDDKKLSKITFRKIYTQVATAFINFIEFYKFGSFIGIGLFFCYLLQIL
jgi:hypothetical protein